MVDGSSQTKYEELYHNFPHQQNDCIKISNTLIKLLALIDAKKIDGQFDGCEFDSLKNHYYNIAIKCKVITLAT